MNRDDANVFPSPPESEIPAPEPPAFRYPEDIRTPWGWGDLLVFVGLAVALLFFIEALAILLAPAFHLPRLTQEMVKHPTPAITVYLLLVSELHYLFLMAYLFARIRAGFGLPFWQAIRWRWFDFGTVSRPMLCSACLTGGAAFSIVIQFASAELGKPTKLPIEAFFEDRQSAMLLIFVSTFLAPLVEEIIFRGYLYPVLARSTGVGGGVLLTGTIFGLLHAFQLWGGWGQIALLVVVGIVFTYARAISRSVFASYLVHLGYNTCINMAFLISTNGLRHMPFGT